MPICQFRTFTICWLSIIDNNEFDITYLEQIWNYSGPYIKIQIVCMNEIWCPYILKKHINTFDNAQYLVKQSIHGKINNFFSECSQHG